jgi:hypothetical protein
MLSTIFPQTLIRKSKMIVLVRNKKLLFENMDDKEDATREEGFSSLDKEEEDAIREEGRFNLTNLAKEEEDAIREEGRLF